MLLTRSLPLQVLLPAWCARQLRQVLQRAHKSDSATANSKFGRGPSLFEELFPEEKESSTPPQNGRNEELRKLPAFNWLGAHSTEDQHKTQKEKGFFDSLPQQAPSMEEKPCIEPSVLVLGCATKTLEESDFFRLSPKGEHIDGWTSGITKVIPNRDPITFEYLGCHFIVFSSGTAARAYLDQINRLYKLSKTNARGSMASLLPPPPGYIKDGEDLYTTLQGFTLIPASQNFLSLRKMIRPYKSFLVNMINDNGPVAKASRLSNSEGMVLFSVDRGLAGVITIFDLRLAIGDDGKRRNLQWQLVDGENDIIKINTREAEEDHPESGARMGGEEAHRDTQQKRQIPVTPSRYIISFKDRQEARRFVMEWHRRPFPIRRAWNPRNESTPIVNAEILW